MEYVHFCVHGYINRHTYQPIESHFYWNFAVKLLGLYFIAMMQLFIPLTTFFRENLSWYRRTEVRNEKSAKGY